MKLKCIDNKRFKDELTIGKIYSSLPVPDLLNNNWCKVLCDNGETHCFRKSRFTIAENNPNKKNNLIAELKKAQQIKTL